MHLKAGGLELLVSGDRRGLNGPFLADFFAARLAVFMTRRAVFLAAFFLAMLPS